MGHNGVDVGAVVEERGGQKKLGNRQECQGWKRWRTEEKEVELEGKRE